MQAVVINEGPPPWVRWMAIPAAVLIIVLVSLAIDTEGRGSFIERTRVEAAQREQFEDLDNTRIIITTENGSVELSLDGETVLGEDGNGDIEVLAVRPDENGDIIGFRVTEDGTFEPIRVGEDFSGETVILPNGQGGFDLIRPDGTRTTLNVDENGDLQATGPGGGGVPLAPNENGEYDLGGGLTADESNINPVFPDDPADDGALPAPNGPTEPAGLDWRTIIIVALGFLGLAGTVWWFFAMRPNTTTYLPPATVPAGAAAMPGRSPWEAFEAYLSELSANPDPTQAIRLAYAYAEQGVGRLPPRDREQTPHEWVQSIAPNDPEVANLLWPLTERYAATRFAGHSATSAERDGAVNELRTLVHQACS